MPEPDKPVVSIVTPADGWGRGKTWTHGRDAHRVLWHDARDCVFAEDDGWRLNQLPFTPSFVLWLLREAFRGVNVGAPMLRRALDFISVRTALVPDHAGRTVWTDAKLHLTNQSPKALIVKMVFIGEAKTGKTSIIRRMATGDFSTSYIMTIGFDFKLKHTTRADRLIKMQMWDTIGDARWRQIKRANRSNLWRGADAFVVCFALNDRRSFDKLDAWADVVSAPWYHTKPKFLVANMADLPNEEWEVSRDEAHAKAAVLGWPLFEVSAATGMGVAAAVDQVACSGLVGSAQEREREELEAAAASAARRKKGRCQVS